MNAPTLGFPHFVRCRVCGGFRTRERARLQPPLDLCANCVDRIAATAAHDLQTFSRTLRGAGLFLMAAAPIVVALLLWRIR